MKITGRKTPQGGNSRSSPVKGADDIRAKEVRNNRIMVLVMFILIALAIVIAAGQASFVRNGSIKVIGNNYYKLETETDTRAIAASALNAEKAAYKKLDLTVPDYCPVNYKANSPIAMVYDKTTGEVLYSKNESERCYPASVAKLMTAAAALDMTAEGYQFVAGDELDLVEEDAPMAKINKCFAFNRTEITDGIILKGGSDISYTAAACVGRLLSEDDDISPERAVSEFVSAMNSTAKKIGAENTRFTNPDGYFDEGNYTTASDMIRIAAYAMEHKEIASAAAKEHAGGKFASGQTYEWLNTNSMVVSESNRYYEYATGLKTGMTSGAGYCAAASAERYGHTLICVVMNCDSDENRYYDIKNLFDISFSYIEEQGDIITETEAADEEEETGETSEEISEEFL